MKHTQKNSITENMHGILECTFVDYANRLRASYPKLTIGNAAVFASGVPEFARLCYIELIDARTNISRWPAARFGPQNEARTTADLDPRSELPR